MTALTSKTAEWMTPKWLVDYIREALGGEITLDPASNEKANKIIKARRFYTKADDSLTLSWAQQFKPGARPALFLNPPGDVSGKLVRKFWSHYRLYAPTFWATCWLGFNLDQLRFVERFRDVRTRIVVPRKRVAYIDEDGKEGKFPTIGSFLYFTGNATFNHFPREHFNIW